MAYWSVRRQGRPVCLLQPTNKYTITEYANRLSTAEVHDLTSAAIYFDRIVFLRDGQMVVDGPPRTTITAATIARVFDADVRVDRDVEGIPAIRPRRGVSPSGLP